MIDESFYFFGLKIESIEGACNFKINKSLGKAEKLNKNEKY